MTLSDPPTLHMQQLQTTDEGLYMCRVDFLKSPTEYTRVNLTILGKLNLTHAATLDN